jgi:hypothetical protein
MRASLRRLDYIELPLAAQVRINCVDHFIGRTLKRRNRDRRISRERW